jgi:hypothetical protein
MSEATYPLDWVKQLIGQSQWIVTGTALKTASDLGFDEEDILECITKELAETHFYKTMPSETRPNLMQDVYLITYQGQRLYVKVQVSDDDWVTIISFKKSEREEL